MGKGDPRSRRGKLRRGTHGKSRRKREGGRHPAPRATRATRRGTRG